MKLNDKKDLEAEEDVTVALNEDLAKRVKTVPMNKKIHLPN